MSNKMVTDEQFERVVKELSDLKLLVARHNEAVKNLQYDMGALKSIVRGPQKHKKD